jgi:sulfoxide reductase heme-binding subunit YedZ
MLRMSRFQWLVHIASWIPLVVLVYDYIQSNLTVNPIQTIEIRTGRIAITFLMLALTCTPLITLAGFRPALKVRRPLGLYAFMYATLHFLTFFLWDYGGNLHYIWLDVGNKLYIFVGLAALLILIPLAATSTKKMMRKMGKRWKLLHKLVYAAGVLAVLHYFWAVKVDIRLPIAYGALLVLLLALRLPPLRRLVSRSRNTWLPRITQVLTSNPFTPEIK